MHVVTTCVHTCMRWTGITYALPEAKHHKQKWRTDTTLLSRNIRVQYSDPSFAQVVHDVDSAVVEYADTHVTVVLTPSLFAHVFTTMDKGNEHVARSIFTRYLRQNKIKSNVWIQHSAPSLTRAVPTWWIQPSRWTWWTHMWFVYWFRLGCTLNMFIATGTWINRISSMISDERTWYFW